MKRKMITLATAILTLSLATACGSETPNTESTAANESVSVAVATQTSEDTSTSVEGTEESSVEVIAEIVPTKDNLEQLIAEKVANIDKPNLYPYSFWVGDENIEDGTVDEVQWIGKDGKYYFGYYGDKELTPSDWGWVELYEKATVTNADYEAYKIALDMMEKEGILDLVKAAYENTNGSTITDTPNIPAQTGYLAQLPYETTINGVTFKISAYYNDYQAKTSTDKNDYLVKNNHEWLSLYADYVPEIQNDNIYSMPVNTINEIDYVEGYVSGASAYGAASDSMSDKIYNLAYNPDYSNSAFYNFITESSMLTTNNGLVVVKKHITFDTLPTDFATDKRTVISGIDKCTVISDIGSVYLVYVPFTDGSFYKLSYVTAVSDTQSEDTILAAIDEYAAQYGLTQ